jgi:imidazolonepropionase-like amidohydrolase
MKFYLQFILLLILVTPSKGQGQSSEIILIKGVTLIDGTGKPAQKNVNVEIKNNKISAISSKAPLKGSRVIDLSGKTIMPLITNVHGHLGMATGNYTSAQIVKELERYQLYGVGAVVSMGTDKESIFAVRDSSRSGRLPGADVYTAGYGFRPPLGNKPQETGMEKIFRPATAEQAIKNVQELARLKVDMVKIWVDDMGGTTEKIKPEVYRAIIAEAHKNGLPVAAHLYYAEDAHQLIDAGVDIFAHSIRDREVDDALISKMKAKGIVYIPTLTRDGYEFFYGDHPAWLRDPFFKASLEPGVFETITSEEYRKKEANNPGRQKNMTAYSMALRNLKKIHAAGILVAFGTDSGAQPRRAQGFSEHLELQLMVEAGLTPLEAITIASRNSCQVLKVKDQGTLQPGMNADFMVLNQNPLDDIKATRTIHSVWKKGVMVNKGPELVK